MKIKILSDLHTEFEEFKGSGFIPDESNCDVTIMAGDIATGTKAITWLRDNYRKPVIYVAGNHELYGNTYPKLFNKIREECAGTNIFFLEDGHINIDGINFIGCTLWSDFNLFSNVEAAIYECYQVMNDFKKIRIWPNYSKIRPNDMIKIHKNSLLYLEKKLEEAKNEPCVIVTHHAPGMQSIPEHYMNDFIRASYASDLKDFVLKHSPKLWLHGHIHYSSDYYIGATRVICNPRSYPDQINPEFNDNFIVEI